MNALAHLALSGEQPMPILLPDRFLQWLLPHTGSEEVDPYNLPTILARLNALAPADQPTIVNLTGVAKMMMLAAFALAMQRGWDFVYWTANAPLNPAPLPGTEHTEGRLQIRHKKGCPQMLRLCTAIIATFILFTATCQSAYADDDYLVPVVVAGKTYTLTVTVGDAGISVRVGDKDVTVGEVTKVLPAVTLAAQQDLDALKVQAVTIPYDDLFRYNERHVDKIVRYVGKVLQVQENECLLCENPGYVLRVAVTEGSYGLWDDPIWVEYEGTDRFLEDDIVTVWGVVKGLQKYSAILGNQVTIPLIKASDIKLGEVANPRRAAAAASSAGGSPVANRNANLRGGPGTGYPVVGAAEAGEALTIVARNAAGDWLQLADGAWIATFLVENAPAPADLPVASDISVLPTPTPQPAEVSAATTTTDAPSGGADTSSSIVPVGQEIEAGDWRFKVSELHKRKAVYFYDNSHIAMGHFLVVVIDATNLQSGTDYFDRNIDPWVTDEAGKAFSTSGTASGYAQWQFGGISSLYTNVNPGNFVRIAFAVDLPDSTGRLLLSTDVGKWIDLGNFAEMQT